MNIPKVFYSFFAFKHQTLVVILFFVFNACTINRSITYSTSDIQAFEDRPLSHLSVTIMEFTDARREVAGNDLQFKDSRQTFMQSKIHCVNSERHYKTSPISKQITQMLIAHLNKKKTFKQVQLNNIDSCDYVITATVARFNGLQPVTTLSRVGPQFGLIGGVAASFAKSVTKTSFAITDIKVLDKNMVLVKDLGSFAMEFEDELFVDAECWCIYENVNEKLKDFNKEFIQFLETEMASIR